MSDHEAEGTAVDLTTFISEAINGIVEGIAKGQAKLAPPRTLRLGHPFAHSVCFSTPKEISFDIAVTVNRHSAGSGGAKIEVMGIGLGAKGEVARDNSITTRLAFAVPIVPVGEEND
ncbi:MULTISPECIES: hypothetical protein [Sphingobium]|uniref:hypothetical protein n=1 Tax=Sphingobium TaxID=165695 RepID=UPI00159C64CA|nr:hypothetical protein [Sphingobium sp. 15-1]